MSVSLFYTCVSVSLCVFQAVEELLESLELEKSSYHMGLSRVSQYLEIREFRHMDTFDYAKENLIRSRFLSIDTETAPLTHRLTILSRHMNGEAHTK